MRQTLVGAGEWVKMNDGARWVTPKALRQRPAVTGGLPH